MTDYIYKGDSTIPFAPDVPESITFQVGSQWALKITKDGITSNPDVPTDDGAKAMLAALDGYIKQLIRS